MRALTTAVLGGCVLGLSLTDARAEPFGWAISASSTDAFVQTAPPVGPGLLNLWLWLICDEVGGAAAAEFDVVATGDISGPFGFTPQPSWINGGAAAQLLLAVGGCPTSPMLAGQLVLADLGAGGTVCIVPSAANGLNVTVDCSYPQPRAFPNMVLGFASDGSSPCVTGSCADPTGIGDLEKAPWGRVKGLYR